MAGKKDNVLTSLMHENASTQQQIQNRYFAGLEKEQLILSDKIYEVLKKRHPNAIIENKDRVQINEQFEKIHKKYASVNLDEFMQCLSEQYKNERFNPAAMGKTRLVVLIDFWYNLAIAQFRKQNNNQFELIDNEQKPSLIAIGVPSEIHKASFENEYLGENLDIFMCIIQTMLLVFFKQIQEKEQSDAIKMGIVKMLFRCCFIFCFKSDKEDDTMHIFLQIYSDFMAYVEKYYDNSKLSHPYDLTYFQTRMNLLSSISSCGDLEWNFQNLIFIVDSEYWEMWIVQQDGTGDETDQELGHFINYWGFSDFWANYILQKNISDLNHLFDSVFMKNNNKPSTHRAFWLTLLYIPVNIEKIEDKKFMAIMNKNTSKLIYSCQRTHMRTWYEEEKQLYQRDKKGGKQLVLANIKSSHASLTQELARDGLSDEDRKSCKKYLEKHEKAMIELAYDGIPQSSHIVRQILVRVLPWQFYGGFGSIVQLHPKSIVRFFALIINIFDKMVVLTQEDNDGAKAECLYQTIISLTQSAVDAASLSRIYNMLVMVMKGLDGQNVFDKIEQDNYDSLIQELLTYPLVLKYAFDQILKIIAPLASRQIEESDHIQKFLMRYWFMNSVFATYFQLLREILEMVYYGPHAQQLNEQGKQNLAEAMDSVVQLWVQLRYIQSLITENNFKSITQGSKDEQEQLQQQPGQSQQDQDQFLALKRKYDLERYHFDQLYARFLLGGLSDVLRKNDIRSIQSTMIYLFNAVLLDNRAIVQQNELDFQDVFSLVCTHLEQQQHQQEGSRFYFHDNGILCVVEGIYESEGDYTARYSFGEKKGEINVGFIQQYNIVRMQQSSRRMFGQKFYHYEQGQGLLQ